LVELLVVMAILAILLGAAIPVLAPASDARRIREAARAAHTFISGAKVRAKETGRPFGVALKRLSKDTGRAEDNGVCLEMYYVEEPPPYAGFDDNARAMLSYDLNSSGAIVPGQINVRFVRVSAATGRVVNDPLPRLFRVGDRIQLGSVVLEFNDTGSAFDARTGYYTDIGSTIGAKVVAGNKAVGSSTVQPTSRYTQLLNLVYDNDLLLIANGGNPAVPYWTAPLRYKILRQPVKTSNEAFQLPNKMAIDLEACGMGDGTRLHDPYARVNPANEPNPAWESGWREDKPLGPDNDDDIIIMFSPEGAVAEVLYNAGPRDEDGNNTTGQNGDFDAYPVRRLASSNVFLLVGLRENIVGADVDAPDIDFGKSFDSAADKEKAKKKINWLNGDSRWLVIGARTGALATAENAFVDPQDYADGPLDGTVTSGPMLVDAADELSYRRGLEIQAAREFARQAIGMGGR
ncbi:MAG: type II secretion system protein, partial [Planctomycetales bacterium]|nr:type II secretion system protein [Planctomycetales bacterium]